jgi:hypothetical protein
VSLFLACSASNFCFSSIARFCLASSVGLVVGVDATGVVGVGVLFASIEFESVTVGVAPRVLLRRIGTLCGSVFSFTKLGFDACTAEMLGSGVIMVSVCESLTEAVEGVDGLGIDKTAAVFDVFSVLS